MISGTPILFSFFSHYDELQHVSRECIYTTINSEKLKIYRNGRKFYITIEL